MARTRIENPTRVSVETVGDPNKYQMSRNRNIEQTNQYLETNVAANVQVQPKSDLLRIAESLKDVNPILQKYIDDKTEEYRKQEEALGIKNALENNPKDLTQAQKDILDKSMAYKKGYMSMFAENSYVRDSEEFKKEWSTLPEHERLKTNAQEWLTNKIKEKNKGIEDVTFNNVYNSRIMRTVAELTSNSFVEKTEFEKDNFMKQVRENVWNKPEIFSNIDDYQSYKKSLVDSGLITNKEFDDFILKTAEDMSKNADGKSVEWIDKLSSLVKQNPKTKEGIPIFDKIANSSFISQITLNTFKAMREKEKLEQDLKNEQLEKRWNTTFSDLYKVSLTNTKAALDGFEDLMKDPEMKERYGTQVDNVYKILRAAKFEEESLVIRQRELRQNSYERSKSKSQENSFDSLVYNMMTNKLTVDDIIEDLGKGKINGRQAWELQNKIFQKEQNIEQQILEAERKSKAAKNEEEKKKAEEEKRSLEFEKTRREDEARNIKAVEEVSGFVIGKDKDLPQHLRDKFISQKVSETRNLLIEFEEAKKKGLINGTYDYYEFIEKRKPFIERNLKNVLNFKPEKEFIPNKDGQLIFIKQLNDQNTMTEKIGLRKTREYYQKNNLNFIEPWKAQYVKKWYEENLKNK